MVSTCTLLIVDDCAEDREVCRRYLSKDPHQSYQILEADSAEGGLSLCQQQSCDAILLDFCLPTMNGLEFLDALKQHQPDMPFPVILLTGQGAEAVAVRAMKMGVQDYLVKQELNPDVLQLTVRNVIQQWRSQLQLTQAEQRQRLISTMALHLRQSLDRKQILQRAVTEIQQFLACDGLAIYQASSADSSLASRPTGWVKLAAIGPPLNAEAEGFDQWLCSDRSLTPRTRSADPTSQPSGHAPIKTGRDTITPTRLVLPIFFQSQPQNSAWLWGILVAHHTSERQWQPEEIEILKALVGQLAIALQQAEQLHQMQLALEQAKLLNAFKSQMVASVSHEYRSLLSAILAAASTLKLQAEQINPVQRHFFLSTIEEKARVMTRLVEELLVLEKLELGKVKLNPLPFNVLDFFADIVEEQRQIAGSSYEIVFSISGNSKGFWGDQELMRQVLVNLLSNAIKYSPDGGRITLHLTGDDTHLTFSVQDHGIGIPLADQEQLFQAFQRGSNVETIAGTGLGLAIVKACVALHRGEIRIESIEDEGTTVTVILPKRQPA